MIGTRLGGLPGTASVDRMLGRLAMTPAPATLLRNFRREELTLSSVAIRPRIVIPGFRFWVVGHFAGLSFRAKRGISQVLCVQSEIPRFARNDSVHEFGMTTFTRIFSILLRLHALGHHPGSSIRPLQVMVCFLVIYKGLFGTVELQLSVPHPIGDISHVT